MLMNNTLTLNQNNNILDLSIQKVLADKKKTQKLKKLVLERTSDLGSITYQCNQMQLQLLTVFMITDNIMNTQIFKVINNNYFCNVIGMATVTDFRNRLLGKSSDQVTCYSDSWEV